MQALGKGATATDTITVHSADGTQHQAAAATINGTNDRPTISEPRGADRTRFEYGRKPRMRTRELNRD
ncbi:VCBS domain-containing protein [Vibrio chagasii]|nr:VCBS domain-containing protein [Vibrio chagasii]